MLARADDEPETKSRAPEAVVIVDRTVRQDDLQEYRGLDRPLAGRAG
jgi:hypothetical protein